MIISYTPSDEISFDILLEFYDNNVYKEGCELGDISNAMLSEKQEFSNVYMVEIYHFSAWMKKRRQGN